MNLKELIKQLTREILDEQSSSNGGTGNMSGGPGMATATPNWVAPLGKKENAATKTAEKEGWKPAKGIKPKKIVQVKQLWGNKKSAMQESLQSIIEQELLNEVTYSKFKNEVKYRTKAEQLHKAIREVKRKLLEIDRIVEYTSRMKGELSEGDGIQYWNRTNKAVATISEMVNVLNNKIKNLQQ